MTPRTLHRIPRARVTTSERQRVIARLLDDYDAALAASPAAARRRVGDLLRQLDLPRLRRLLVVVQVDPSERLPDPEC